MRRDFRLFLRIALRITSRLISPRQQIITGRTHLKQGGFCLKTGAPQRVKSSFSRKREWSPIIFSRVLK